MHVLGDEVTLVLQPIRGVPRVLARVPGRVEGLDGHLEVGDHPPQAANPVAGEEAQQHQLEYQEHPRVEELLKVLHVTGQLGEPGELGQLRHAYQPQHSVDAAHIRASRTRGIRSLVDQIAVRIVRPQHHQQDVEREGAEHIHDKGPAQIVLGGEPVVRDELALVDIPRAEVDEHVEDEPDVHHEVAPKPKLEVRAVGAEPGLRAGPTHRLYHVSLEGDLQGD